MKIAMFGMSSDMFGMSRDMSLDIPSFPPMAFHIEGFTLHTAESERKAFLFHSVLVLLLLLLLLLLFL